MILKAIYLKEGNLLPWNHQQLAEKRKILTKHIF